MHEEYKDSEYGEEKLVRFSFLPPMIAILIVILIVFIGVFSYGIYKTMLDVYEDEVNVQELNKKYMKVIDQWDKNDSSYVISPLATDLSLSDFVSTSDTDMFVKASSVEMYNRGYKSFDESVKWINSIAKAEDIKNINMKKSSEKELQASIDSSFDSQLEIPNGTFDGADVVSIVKLPNKLVGTVTESDRNVYVSGTYYEDKGRYKLEFADGKHEAIFYKGDFDSDFDWKKKEGIVKLPRTMFSTASTTNQSLGGINGDFKCITSQILVYGITSDEKVKGDEPKANAEVRLPYNVAIVNKDTNIIVAGGVIKE